MFPAFPAHAQPAILHIWQEVYYWQQLNKSPPSTISTKAISCEKKKKNDWHEKLTCPLFPKYSPSENKISVLTGGYTSTFGSRSVLAGTVASVSGIWKLEGET